MILDQAVMDEATLEALEALDQDARAFDELQEANRVYFLRMNRPQEHMSWSDCYVRSFFGGNRSGKTTFGINEDIAYMCGRRLWLPEDHPRYFTPFKPPVKGVLFCESYELFQDVHVPKFYEWTPAGWIKEIRKQGNTVGIKFVAGPGKGSQIKFQTYEQKAKKAESKDWHFAHFDEPPPYDVYMAVTRGMVDHGGKIWLTMTLLSEGWLWDEIWERAEAGDPDYFAVVGSIYDNVYDPETGSGALSLKNVDRFASGMDASLKQVRLMGKPQHLQGRIFKLFKPQPPWVVEEYEPKPDWPALRSFDPHAARPIAGVWSRLTQANRVIITDCLFDEDLPKSMEALRDRVNLIEKTKRHQIAMSLMDSAGGAEDVNGYSVFDHFRKHGIPCRPAKKANKLARILRMSEMFNVDPMTGLPMIVIMRNPGTEKLVWEIQRYTHPTFKNKSRDEKWKELREGADKRDDHLIDCLAYQIAEDPQYDFLRQTISGLAYMNDFGQESYSESSYDFDSDEDAVENWGWRRGGRVRRCRLSHSVTMTRLTSSPWSATTWRETRPTALDSTRGANATRTPTETA